MRIVCGAGVCAMLLCLVPHQGAAVGRLVLATGAKQPLTTPQHDGFLDLFAKDVFRRIEYQVKVYSLPPERALRNANLGIDDGDLYRVGGLSRLYPNLIQVPEPTLDMTFLAFSRRPVSVKDGWASLHSHSVGCIRGWKIVTQKLEGKATLTYTDYPRALFDLLYKRHVDVAIYSRWQGLYIAEEMGFSDIRANMPPLSVNHMFMYLNKRYAAIVPAVANAIKAAKEDGTFDRLYMAKLAPLLATH